MSEESFETRLAVHEATSLARYQHIEDRLEAGDKRMTRIEYLLYAVIAAVLLGPGAAAQVIHKLCGI